MHEASLSNISVCVRVHNQNGINPRFFASLRMTLHDRRGWARSWSV